MQRSVLGSYPQVLQRTDLGSWVGRWMGRDAIYTIQKAPPFGGAFCCLRCRRKPKLEVGLELTSS